MQLTNSEYQNRIFLFQICFIISLVLIMIYQGTYPTWSVIAILLVIVSVWSKLGWSFIKDFLPFFLILVTYGTVYNQQHSIASGNVEINLLINFEKFLFSGYIPSAYIQNSLLFKEPWYDILKPLMEISYMTHFTIPIVFAWIIWQKQKNYYWQYITGFLILTYAGFLTFTFFPAAPPWYASYYGYLQGSDYVKNISFFTPEILINSSFPVAAIPSLHAAYPFYVSLFTLFIWGKKTSLVFIYPLIISFATLYLGHHYVIDLLIGYTYAAISYVISLKLLNKKSHESNQTY